LGDGEPRRGVGAGRLIAMSAGSAPGSATIEYLKDWELHGASWKALEITDRKAVIELCSCFGEPMDRIEGDDPELIAYVRERGGQS
jgi:hypothetical protein